MKNLVLLGLIMTVCITTYAQSERDARIYFWPEDTSTHKYSFRGTVYLRGIPEKTIYNSAVTFVKNNFYKQGEKVLYKYDSISTIACKGIYPIAVVQLGDKGKGYINYKLLIECFDNGYLYTITNFEHIAQYNDGVIGGNLERSKAATGSLGFPNQYWETVKEKCYYNVQTTIEQMKEFIDKHSKLPA